MKHTATIALALCAAVFSSTAAGGDPIKPIRSLTAPRLLPVQSLKVPPLYTSAQRAAALAKTMNLTVAPPLGAPFSVTPGKPMVPNAGGLIMTDVQAYDGSHNNPNGSVVFRNSTAAAFIIELHAQPGKRYAIDCRTSAPRIFYSYSGGSGAPLHGEAEADGNSHVVFATGAMPADEWILISSYLATEDFTPTTKVLGFYGCEVSPF